MRTSPAAGRLPTKTAQPAQVLRRRNAPAAPQAVERIPYIDRLKVALVALIIAGHGAMSYSDLENAWPYQDVREVSLPEGVNIALGAIVLPAALFTMGLFFLISGLLTPASLTRKGSRRYMRDRLRRLGVPLAVWVLALWPAIVYAAHRAGGEHRSYWSQFMDADPFLDTGPMWFVEVLLIYSLAYAAWRARQDRRARRATRGERRRREPRRLTGGTIIALAAAISLGTMLVRLVFPLASPQPAHPNLWQWPQYLGLFGLGIVAARRRWLAPIPPRLARRCGVAAVLGLVAFVLLAVAMAATGVEGDVLFDERLHWATMTLAAIEGPLAVGASLWLLAASQRRLGRPLGRRGRALARSAFAAFILQGAVLISVAIALRPVDLPSEVKAVTVAALGTAGSFALASVLVTRTPLRRIL